MNDRMFWALFVGAVIFNLIFAAGVFVIIGKVFHIF